MQTWSQLNKLVDGDSLNAATLNLPLTQLGSRTDYLRKKVQEMGDGLSAIVIPNAPLSAVSGYEPEIGNVVYYNVDDQAFRKAQAKMSLYDDFTAADAAFAVGILQSKEGSSGNVLVYGRLALNTGSPISKANLLESGETFRSGRYYLSATEAGKITANPGGPLIYIGSFQSNGDDTKDFTSSSCAYVNPQFLDIGTSHVHRNHVMTARPAGDLSSDGTTVIGYLPIEPEENLTSSSSSGSFSPSLIFGGTWTSESDTTYQFFLSEAGDWSSVELRWYKNGDQTRYSHVAIPAPGVSVPVENGLTVKVKFPKATSSSAYVGLTANQRTWAALTFPEAGKGWVNHGVDAVAGVPSTDSSSSSSSESTTPSVRVGISGSFSRGTSSVSVAFPTSVGILTFTAATVADGSTFVYGGTTYVFANDPSTVATGSVGVQCGATVHDSVLNLALSIEGSESSSSSSSLKALARESDLVILNGSSVTGGTNYQGASFTVLGGIIPLLAVYDEDHEILSDSSILRDIPTYARTSSGNISVSVYQVGAGNVVVEPGTVLTAEVFDDEQDALYDYVLGLDPELAAYYPPVPAKSASLLVNGVEMDSASLFPDNPTVSFGAKTIHWFANAAGLLPWPKAFVSRSATVNAADDKMMVFSFVRGFQCATGPVTSLQAAPGSGIKVYTYGTDSVNNVGDLMLDAALDFKVKGAGVAGYNAVKTGRRGNLLAGPVVEKILAGPGINVTQETGCPSGQGTVTISLDDETFRGNFDNIALENAKQEKLGMFPYIRLLGYTGSLTTPSAFVSSIRIPTNLPDRNYRLGLYATVFGESAFSGSDVAPRYAGIALDYNILPDFTDDTYLNLKTGLVKPDSARKINIPFGHAESGIYSYVAFDPMLVSTTDSSLSDSSDVIVSAFGNRIPAAADFSRQTISPTIRPGYLVAVRLARAEPTTGTAYTGALGFLSLRWTLITA